jgi:N-acyl amino acid synthase of PEP-CTERM/exosortase system
MINEQASGSEIREENGAHFVFRRVHIGMDRSVLREVFSLRYRVYCLERGFLPAEAYSDGLESDEYDECSIHFGAFNRSNQIAGTVRLIQAPDNRQFPFQLHCRSLFQGLRLPPRIESGEVSRLIVDKKYHRRRDDTPEGISKEFLESEVPLKPPSFASTATERRINSPEIVLGLYRQMYQYALVNDIRYWYAAMPRSLARLLSRLGFTFTPIGEESSYYGTVIPYVGDLRELERTLNACNPELLAWFRQ